MPDQLDIYPDTIREGVSAGEPAASSLYAGRLTMTVESKASGQHITVRANCKRKVGSKWERCTFDEATHVFLEVPRPDAGWPDKIGTYYPSGKYAGQLWYDTRADKARVWCATRILRIAAGVAEMEDAQARILLGTSCMYCGRELTDPASIDRQIGPDCAQTISGFTHQVKVPGSAQPEPELVEDAPPGLPAGAEGSRHPFTDEDLAEMNERSGATDPEEAPATPREGLRRIQPGQDPGDVLRARQEREADDAEFQRGMDEAKDRSMGLSV